MNNNHKLEAIIKPCPWCKYTGRFILDVNRETWLPQVKCLTPQCQMKPGGRYQAIRKTSKKDILRFKEKVFKAISYWNENNPIPPYEKTIINLSAIWSNFE